MHIYRLYKNFIIISIYVLLLTSISQSEIPSAALEMPGIYKKGVVCDTIYKPETIREIRRAWVVFSDRDGNKTYDSPGGNPFKRLSYLEMFYVGDERDEYVRIFKDPKINVIKFSGAVQDYGWIHKKFLLLWRTAMITQNQIKQKGMIMNTLEAIGGIIDLDKSVFAFLDGPSPQADTTGYKLQIFDFFYVYKTSVYIDENNATQTYILLGKDPHVNYDNKIKEVIWGWAPKSKVVSWDHRIALEPNWESNAIRERQLGERAKFFKDDPTALKFSKGKSNEINDNDIVWDSDPLENRPNGYWRRFPFLGKSKRNPEIIYYAGVMGEVYLTDKNIPSGSVSSEEWSNIVEKATNAISEFRNINIVFVVDGTLSMNPYFPAIQRAIKESIQLLDQEGTYNIFRFGGVVYRDYNEKESKWREMRVIGKPDVADWFIGKEFHETNTSVPERMYYGLEGALFSAGLIEKQTNVVILIGDVGNHKIEDKVDLLDIKQELARLRCHLIAFQVHCGSDSAYTDFISQTKDLILSAALTNYNELRSYNFNTDAIKYPTWENIDNIYTLKDGVVEGWVFGLNAGQIMDTTILSDKLVNFIVHVNEKNNYYVKIINEIIQGRRTLQEVTNAPSKFADYSSPMAPGIRMFFKDCGITDEQLKLLESKKFQIYIKGWTTNKVGKQKEPLFKNVIFLTHWELNNLIHDLNEMYEALGETALRENMQNAMLNLLAKYTGEPQSALMDKTISDLNEVIIGLPLSNNIFKKVRIIDIIDVNVFTEVMLAKYRDALRKSQNTLMTYSQGKCELKFESNDQLYYWIDEDVFQLEQ